MERHYRINGYTAENDMAVCLINKMQEYEKNKVNYDKLKKIYIELCSQIREDLNIKNAISIGISKDVVLNKEVLNIHIYDYELPNLPLPKLYKVGFEEESERLYIEVE